MTISAGDWTVFFTRPLSAAILALAVLALFGPSLYAVFTRLEGRARARIRDRLW